MAYKRSSRQRLALPLAGLAVGGGQPGARDLDLDAPDAVIEYLPLAKEQALLNWDAERCRQQMMARR